MSSLSQWMVRPSVGALMIGLVGCAGEADFPNGDAQTGDGGGAQDGAPEDASGEAAQDATSDAPAADGATGLDGSPSGEGGTDSSVPVEDCEALTATVRDMKDSHPDFENTQFFDASVAMGGALAQGIVEDELGADRKPVYVGGSTPVASTGADEFAQWYQDVDDVNMAFEIEIPLTEENTGEFVFDSDAFFPLDDMGFGNQGREHNYHFTTEVHTAFVYRGGEVFTFEGDDDLWMFVNGQLVIDLGGLHPPRQATVDFDARAEELGLEIGQRYPMDIFHAERHTKDSNFRVQTSIDCFVELL